MTTFTPTDYPELSLNWIDEARRRFKEKFNSDYIRISSEIGVHKLDAFWFFKGNPVVRDTFEAICRVLELDPGEVMESDRQFNAFLETADEWAGVYEKLAESDRHG